MQAQVKIKRYPIEKNRDNKQRKTKVITKIVKVMSQIRIFQCRPGLCNGIAHCSRASRDSLREV
jgi:hypothetical protein